MSDTLGNDAPRTWPRACSVRAPHGAPSTWQHALNVRIELTRLQQVRTRAHQLLQPRPPPRTHTSCGLIEHIVVRHADLDRSLTLFAGMAVVATTSMARAQRAVPAISRCVPSLPSRPAPHHRIAHHVRARPLAGLRTSSFVVSKLPKMIFSAPKSSSWSSSTLPLHGVAAAAVRGRERPRGRRPRLPRQLPSWGPDPSDPLGQHTHCCSL